MPRDRAINPLCDSKVAARVTGWPAARPFVLRSGKIREALRSDGEKTSRDKALVVGRRNSRAIRDTREVLGKNRASPCAGPLFAGFRERFARQRIFSTRNGRQRTLAGLFSKK